MRKDEVKNPTQNEDALFKTAKGALLFSLNYQHGSMKRPSMTAMMGGAGRKGKGLGGLDGAAQAGMIQLELGHLTELRRALLVARHAVPSVPCSCRRPCCRGWTENPDWAEAITWLTEYVWKAGLTGSLSHFRFRRTLVARYFGVRETFIAIASSAGVNRDTASSQYRKIAEHLKAEEKLARYEIEGYLKGAGVVE